MADFELEAYKNHCICKSFSYNLIMCLKLQKKSPLQFQLNLCMHIPADMPGKNKYTDIYIHVATFLAYTVG